MMTEITVVITSGEGWGLIAKGIREQYGVIEMFYILSCEVRVGCIHLSKLIG